jgi:hypothetical protein
MPRDLSDALSWLSELLTDLDLPYQVVGGVAATCHGATRPLADIDLYVSDEAALDRLAAASGAHLVQPPRHHHDEHWDLTFLKLERGGFQIEAAAAASAKVWDGRVEAWKPAGIRFDRSEDREIAGVVVPIMPRGQLMDYKGGLGREVDRLDLEEMGRAHSPAPGSA